MNVNKFLLKLRNPQAYTGKEINVVKKNFNKDSINICLVFPDKYEIGMSHYGIKILYHILNKKKDVNVERCFLPEKESIEVFKKLNFPLFSIENKISLKDFDLIGFSVLSEMNYTNILQILELSQIPLKTKDRDRNYPFIAAGGISVINPEPLREFIDFFCIGDGEVLFPDIIKILFEIKRKESNKKSCLKMFDKVEGIYVPSLFPIKKQGRFYKPDLKARKIKKRVLNEIDNSFPFKKIIVPITNVVFNRLDVEIARGCPQTCRFCQAKSFYAPFRVKSLERTIDFIKHALNGTGFESFSLLSLSSGDYPYIKELIELIPGVTNPHVSFSISSLRPSAISDDLLSAISCFRRTGITIVPEAGTQRLRNVINKNVTDDEVFKAVELALKYNWKRIKLYFMIGLPTETIEDIDSIVKLIEKINFIIKSKNKNMKIHASFSPFVPKPHTPLQWAKRESLDIIKKRTNHIKQGLKKYRNVDLDFHLPLKGVVETILTRGDFRVGELILKAFKRGEIYSAWDSDFNYSVWDKLINECNCNDFLSEIDLDEDLPWDFIEVNFKKGFLKKEYERALSCTPYPSCVDLKCETCKACFFEMERHKDLKFQHENIGKNRKETKLDFNKVRIFYEKKGDFKFFSHLSLMKYIERLIRKSGMDFRITEGFHPRIKMISLPPLPVFAYGLNEVIELYLDSKLTEQMILGLLNSVSGELKFKKVVICNESKKLMKDIHFVEYEIKVRDYKKQKDKIKEFITDTDSISYSEDKLLLRIDYSRAGLERFSKIYKSIDPERKFCFNLTRKNVIFMRENI